ncbi:MFS transporter [Sphingomonas alba]|uniref:MFS transporter n=1 Tax=Sphingomonas alba TaxID=2908208 RepID=A0ABT0RNK4_9SPHN|nr:MFS transporter [Sphingomonas alba]MCL6684148.1 MFS transporter [Sphingomonas alba]
MTDLALPIAPPMPRLSASRTVLIAVIGFLTLVDLFATQAILPSLAQIYRVMPSEIGVAANASTLGMAIAGLLAGAFTGAVERKRAISLSLLLLSIPTATLAFAPNLQVFALLRVVQGLFMATAFTLTLTHLAERCAVRTPAALAAYVTGAVAANLIGRLAAALVAGFVGAETSFLFFAALNIAGALLCAVSLDRNHPDQVRDGQFWAAWLHHLGDPNLRRSFAIGFLILFGFIGVFTYVGFVLMRPPFSLSMTALGFVFLVFLPSMITTPLAGSAVAKMGPSSALFGGLVLAIAGLGLLLLPSLAMVILGMALVGVGTFFGQAVATGHVGRTATGDKAAASGLYLSAYYSGGLAGAAVIGQLFDRFGWTASLIGVGFALALAAVLGLQLRTGEENP